MSDNSTKTMENLIKALTNPEIAAASVEAEMEENWKAGVKVIRMDKKGIYELQADGTRIYTAPCPEPEPISWLKRR
ncbi:MAG: hypothetical protein IJ228_09270 [Succinivibrio sp.]|nr:hypothetical protein [Succinivibrio sp.]